MSNIDIAPIDGLTIAADYHETDGQLTTAVQEAQSGNVGAQYAMGNFKVGYSKGHVAPGLTDKNAAVTSYENTSMGIEFAVNDALSISWKEYTSKRHNTSSANPEQEITAINVGYTMGGMTIGFQEASADNANFVLNAEDDSRTIGVSVAF